MRTIRGSSSKDPSLSAHSTTSAPPWSRASSVRFPPPGPERACTSPHDTRPNHLRTGSSRLTWGLPLLPGELQQQRKQFPSRALFFPSPILRSRRLRRRASESLQWLFQPEGVCFRSARYFNSFEHSVASSVLTITCFAGSETQGLWKRLSDNLRTSDHRVRAC